MHTQIEIHKTDFPNKYLFISDNSIFFGGFIIKDIIYLLKENINTEEITKILSDKYETEIDKKEVEKIINEDIPKLIEKTKRNKVIKLLKIPIPSSLKFSKIALSLFNQYLFYPLLIISLIVNTVFFLTNDDFSLLLSNWERFFAILISFIILIFHEVGHIIGAKNYSVNVKESGVGLYFILPVFYVNLNESWKLERKKKVIVNLSGVYFQSLIGVLIASLMLCSSIKTDFLWYLFIINFLIIFINLNPFIKFDGYWVLSDLLKENNLDELSTNFLRNIFNQKKTFPLRIKIYAICKVIFLVSFFGFLFYELFKFINKSIIENNTTNFYILIGGLLLVILANLFNYKYGFSKKKARN